jgi:hypothetical protein
LGLDDGAGVVCDEVAESGVCVVVAEVAGAVEGVKAGIYEGGGVADVVEPGGGFEEVGVVAEDGDEGASLAGYALSVCPAAWEWFGEE